jgi:hypothetical protein
MRIKAESILILPLCGEELHLAYYYSYSFRLMPANAVKPKCKTFRRLIPYHPFYCIRKPFVKLL